ncbi:hypothetical protein HYR99_29785 [Candidatus Poribacteria bacterium]|nr:hypothetical protein [Candidatus Poribacteria bacterium]
MGFWARIRTSPLLAFLMQWADVIPDGWFLKKKIGFWARIGTSPLLVFLMQWAGVIPNGWFWEAPTFSVIIGSAWNLLQWQAAGGTATADAGAGNATSRAANWFFGIIFAPVIVLGIILLIDEMSFGKTELIWFYSSGFFAAVIFIIVGILRGRGPSILGSTELLTFLAILGIAFNWWTDHINHVVRIRLRIENGKQRISGTSFPVPSLDIKGGDLVEIRGTGSTFIGNPLEEFPVGGNDDVIMKNKLPLGCLMPTVDGVGLTDQTLVGDWKALIEGFAPAEGGRLGFDFNFPKLINPAGKTVGVVVKKGDMRLRISVNRGHSAGPERLDRKLKQWYWGVFGRAVTLRGENAPSERVNLEDLSEAFPHHYMNLEGPDNVTAHTSRDKEWMWFTGPEGRKVIMKFVKKSDEEIRKEVKKQMKIVTQ